MRFISRNSLHNASYICVYYWLSFVFLLQTILPANENVAIGIYIFISIVTMIGSLLLPIETKGRPMKVHMYVR